MKHSMKIFSLTFLFIIIFNINSAFSQEKLDFKVVNDSTYNFFIQKRWNELIKLGKSALKNDIDYYYLRMRLGIAYYEKNNYRQAIMHLEKASQFNSGDESTIVYLYYSYIYAGRHTEAIIFSKSMPEDLKQRLNISQKIINNIYIESGYAASDNIKINQNNDVDGDKNIYGDADLIKNTTYLHTGAKFNLSPKVNMYLGYTNLNITKLKQIQQKDSLKDWDDYTLKQNAAYINFDFHQKNGFTFTPALHYLNVGFETILADTNSHTSIHKINKSTVSFNDYVTSLSLTKDISNFNFGINAAFSKLNNNRQNQIGFTCVYYPLGNLNLYSISSITNWSQTGINVQKKKSGIGPPPSISRVIISQTVGFKFYKSSWLELSATFGEIENFSEKNAFIVYNNAGTIKHKYGAALIIPLFQNFEFSLRYTYFENVLLNSQNTGQTKVIFIPHKYINQSFIGGIKWIF